MEYIKWLSLTCLLHYEYLRVERLKKACFANVRVQFEISLSLQTSIVCKIAMVCFFEYSKILFCKMFVS